MVEKNSVVDLGRREESVAEIPDGSSPVGFHGFRAAGWAGDNLANFIPKMGPRGNKGGGSTAEKERPRGVGRACTLESEDVPHSEDACTRTRISVYRRDGGDDAAEKRERPIPRDTRRIRRQAKKVLDLKASSFFVFSIEFDRSEVVPCKLEIITIRMYVRRKCFLNWSKIVGGDEKVNELSNIVTIYVRNMNCLSSSSAGLSAVSFFFKFAPELRIHNTAYTIGRAVISRQATLQRTTSSYSFLILVLQSQLPRLYRDRSKTRRRAFLKSKKPSVSVDRWTIQK